jgi:AcrR family transcriptional regulator
MAIELDPAQVELLGRQAAKSLATQDRIISAVIRLIKKGGYSSASSSRIAREAGVSWGAVQHHFGGKDEILAAVLERSQERFNEVLAASRFSSGESDKRVAKYVTAAWEHYQGEEYMASMEIMLATRDGERTLGGSRKKARNAHLKVGRKIFHDSKKSDKVLQEAINMVHCMLTGMLIEMSLDPDNFKPRPYLGHIKSMLHSMLY